MENAREKCDNIWEGVGAQPFRQQGLGILAAASVTCSSGQIKPSLIKEARS